LEQFSQFKIDGHCLTHEVGSLAILAAILSAPDQETKSMGWRFRHGGPLDAAVKFSLFITGVFVAILCIGTPAEAQNYPWCAYYSGKGGGG
jgi:hypothetical protein